jgi:hypothetical protein
MLGVVAADAIDAMDREQIAADHRHDGGGGGSDRIGHERGVSAAVRTGF